jgi:hypothetical protein
MFIIKKIYRNGYEFQIEINPKTGICSNKCFKGGGGGARIPKTEPVEVITKIDEVKSEEINRQKRASYLAGGKQSTMLSGLQSQLDQRLKLKLGA